MKELKSLQFLGSELQEHETWFAGGRIQHPQPLADMGEAASIRHRPFLLGIG